MTFAELLDTALAGTADSRRFLRAVGVDGLRWLAGRPLERPEPGAEPAPAPSETLAEIPPAAAARLPDLIERRPGLLREWLELVHQRRLRVPAIWLPDLLDIGRSLDVAERELLLEVGGGRMVWLAKLNPAWAFAVYADPEEQFTWGSREDRGVALRRVRSRDPARGRELLGATWRSERGEVRASLLAALERGLSPDDEDFLTDALRDSRREVRECALRLLRRLPDSRWAARWSERATSLVRLSGERLLLGDPAQLDSTSVAADGLDTRSPNTVVFQRMLALAPPSVWPSEMLQAILHSDFGAPLLAGLSEACAAYADAGWCARLVLAALPALDVRPLFVALPAAQAIDVVGRLVELGHRHATLAAVLRDAPEKLDPEAVTQAEAWLDVESLPLWLQPALVRLVDTLDYRLAMRRELEA